MCSQTCSARQDRTAIAALMTTYQGRCNATFDSSCMLLEVGLVRSQGNLGREGCRAQRSVLSSLSTDKGQLDVAFNNWWEYLFVKWHIWRRDAFSRPLGHQHMNICIEKRFLDHRITEEFRRISHCIVQIVEL